MSIKDELLEQIIEWRRQQETLEDMVQEAHNRINFLDEKLVAA